MSSQPHHAEPAVMLDKGQQRHRVQLPDIPVDKSLISSSFERKGNKGSPEVLVGFVKLWHLS